jgi:hypothetical protein
MAKVKAMTTIVDSLLPRPKLDCDVGYDMAVKGASAASATCSSSSASTLFTVVNNHI